MTKQVEMGRRGRFSFLSESELYISAFADTARSPLWVAGACSLLLSLWQFFQLDAINPDGVCYLEAAARVAQGQGMALHWCGQAAWPFYHILVGGLARVTGWSVFAAASVLNALLTLQTVVLFVVIVRFLAASRRIHWLAVLTILLAHHLNAFRTDILRDHGYWAFYLASLAVLLNYAVTAEQGPRWGLAIGWGGLMLVAALFRLEGGIFLLLVPLLACSFRHYRLRAFLQLNSVLFLLMLLAGTALLLNPDFSLHSLGRMDYFLQQLFQGPFLLRVHWQEASAAFGQHVLSVYAARDSSLILALGMAGYYIVCLADCLTPAGLVLVLYAFCYRCMKIPTVTAGVLGVVLMIQLLITAFFLADNFFLARRYIMAFSLTLLLWVPFALDHLIHQWPARRWPLYGAVLLMAVCAVGGIVRMGPSQAHVRQAGEWLASHVLPAETVYANDPRLSWYAHRPGNSPTGKKDERWQQHDWIALRHAVDGENALGVPVQVFYSRRGDTVRLYHREIKAERE